MPKYAPLGQRLDRATYNRLMDGSSPPRSTTEFADSAFLLTCVKHSVYVGAYDPINPVHHRRKQVLIAEITLKEIPPVER